MRKRTLVVVSVLLLAIGFGLGVVLQRGGLLGSPASSTPESVAPPDRQGLQDIRSVLGDAFNFRDAKRVAEVYAEDAELVEVTGETFRGRSAIEKHLTALFDPGGGPLAKSLRVTSTMTSERSIAPGVIVEDGTWESNVVGKAHPNRGRYTTILVSRDGQWRVASHRSWVPVTLPE